MQKAPDSGAFFIGVIKPLVYAIGVTTSLLEPQDVKQ